MAAAIGKVKLGKSGLEVSRLCFGLAPIGDMPGTYGHGVSIEQAHATVRAIKLRMESALVVDGSFSSD